jgi:hypothetical protein
MYLAGMTTPPTVDDATPATFNRFYSDTGGAAIRDRPLTLARIKDFLSNATALRN